MYYTYIPSPVGRLLLIGDGRVLHGLYFDVYKRKPAIDPSWQEDAKPFGPVIRQLQEYFAGARHHFAVPLSYKGTEFQRRVWDVLTTIPYGEVRSYGDVARAIGKPRASRAVGAAVGSNHVSIIIPCHRVLTAAHGISGFGGGVENKQRLLRLEKAAVLPA